MIRLELLSRPAPDAVTGMTFPAYRHLLQLRPALRLLADASRPPVQPVAVVAFDGDAPVGLALAELPLVAGDSPELLSLFVDRAHRGHGLGRRLVRAVEEEVASRGFGTMRTVWTAGRPGSPAFERVLTACEWTPPTPRTLSVRFTVEEAESFPWLHRYPLRDGCEIFPWAELTDGERAALRMSQQATGWIKPDLVPWQYDANGFESVTSVGMRCAGEVVGWVINHQTAPTTLRFTCAYIRKDLGRRGRIMPLFSASIGRLRQGGFTECTFVTPMRHQTMIAFIRRWMAPWVGFLEETRGSERDLASATSRAVVDARSGRRSAGGGGGSVVFAGAVNRGELKEPE
ncbi:MAG: GNAT family N-acetyltransferase [Acidobacteriota bacterium]